jgi:hypothetical protein
MGKNAERTCCSVCMRFKPKRSVVIVLIYGHPTNVCVECMHSINHAYNLGAFASEVDD